MTLVRSALSLVLVVVCGCAADPAKEGVGETSSRDSVSSHKTAICWDDYNCWAPFATTTCYGDGSCLYEERAAADYQGAVAWKPAGGSWQLTRPSNCDKYCGYLMASSPNNVSRWDLGGNFNVGDACSISLAFCFESPEPDKK